MGVCKVVGAYHRGHIEDPGKGNGSFLEKNE